MKYYEKISFISQPVMLAAWPGMGNVGIIATDYIRRKINAKKFAEIDMSQFFFHDSIIVKDGIAQQQEMPNGIFYYFNDPDLIIFESNVQLNGRDGNSIIKEILDVAVENHVSKIYTSAAMIQPMSYEAESKVLIACNNKAHLDIMLKNGVIPMPDGYIAGLNGLLLGVAAARNIDSACLLGTMPTYASNLMYPKASLAIIKVFETLFAADIDTEEIEKEVVLMNRQLYAIEERIRQLFPAEAENDNEISQIEEEKVPHYIMEKIEMLFDKAKSDKKSASVLKEELDRWNLFELYEDRFLDLFE
jgi:uncharacterized protein